MAGEGSAQSSIRARMTIAFALQSVALMLLVCGGLMLYLSYSSLQAVGTTLHLASERVRGELTSTSLESSFHEYVRENGDSLKMDGIALSIVNAAGKTTLQSQSAVPAWPRSRDGWSTEEFKVGSNTVVVGIYRRKTEKALRHEGIVLLVLSMCVVVASATGAWWLVGRTLTPIGLLSQQARRAVAADSLDMRLTSPSRDGEVIELVSTLNALLERVGKTAEAKGRFYAAASHELRTPLQALSGHLEVTLSRERSREEYKETTVEASRQTQRLTALVQGLLLLNQLDRRSSESLPQETSDLRHICDRVLTHFAPLIESKQLRVSIEGLSIAELTAPPQHAEMLARNLIENALKYAASAGEVRILIQLALDRLRLDISNTFPSQNRLDTTALFEPFFRPDESRTSLTGGNGLGLAICKAIADADGWSIALTQRADQVSVVVEF